MTLLFVLGALAFLVLCGVLYQTIGAARDKTRYPPPGRLVDIGGLRLHLIDSGNGGLPVIFESGISASCLNWTQIRTEVSRFKRACAYDRAGLGWSEPEKSRRTASQLTDELHRLLHAAGIPAPYILVGHSFGGLLVSMYAVEHPNDVAGLVLVDPLSAQEWLHPSEAQLRMLNRGVNLARRGALLARIGVVRLALTLFTGGARRVPKLIARLSSGRGESTISRLVGEVAKMPREVWPIVQAHWCMPKSFEALAASLEALPAASAEAASLVVPGVLPASIPVTILSARHCKPDELAQREAVAQNSEHGRHIVAAECGHWIHLDEPALVVGAIRQIVEASNLGS